MKNIEKLLKTIEILRSENGCEWDRAQTHFTIRENMLEEAYEAVDAINSKDPYNLKEELGDVLLQVVLHAQIASDNGDFNFEDVAKTINEKLIYRHPHVFSDTKVEGVEDILKNWEALKQKEKPERTSALDGIVNSQSALMKAHKISKKAVRVGFEWENIEQVEECLKSEFKEFEEAKTPEHKEEELGDILFALVNYARWNNLNCEQALNVANNKFTSRFKKMEELAQKPLVELTFVEWDNLWKEAKKFFK